MRTVAEFEALDYTEIMPDTCTTRRYAVIGTDRLNKDIWDWADLNTDVSCRREVLASNEVAREFIPSSNTAGGDVQRHVNAEYRFYVLKDEDVTERDRIVFDGETYELLYEAPFQDIDSAYTKEVWGARMK